MSNPRLLTLLVLSVALLHFVTSSTLPRNHEDNVEDDDDDDDDDSIVIEAKNYDSLNEEEIVTYEGAQVWRIPEDREKNEFLHYLQDKGDLSLWKGNGTAIDVLILPEVIKRVSRFLRRRSIGYEVIIPDLQQAINYENPTRSAEEIEELEGRNGHRMEWTSYHRFDDINGYLDYLAMTYPSICSVSTIGKSVEGRELKVLRISKGIANAPAIWIDGGIHAREWISPAAVTYLIDYLVEHSDQLQEDYYVLPVANPDGYEFTFKYDRLWRKSRSNPQKGGSCVGVDLNRNFGYHWGGLGTSKSPCREIYAGADAFSEPETDSIQQFFKSTSANFKAYLTFHSYGQYILYPWGYDQKVPPDWKDLDAVGKLMAKAMKVAGGANTVYTVGNSAATLYPAAGGSDDWAKAHVKVKYSYTIELRDRGHYGFILPARFIKPVGEEAIAAVKAVVQAVHSD